MSIQLVNRNGQFYTADQVPQESHAAGNSYGDAHRQAQPQQVYIEDFSKATGNEIEYTTSLANYVAVNNTKLSIERHGNSSLLVWNGYGIIIQFKRKYRGALGFIHLKSGENTDISFRRGLSTIVGKDFKYVGGVDHSFTGPKDGQKEEFDFIFVYPESHSHSTGGKLSGLIVTDDV